MWSHTFLPGQQNHQLLIPLGLFASREVVQGRLEGQYNLRFKTCRLFVLCCVWAVGFGVQGGCVLVVTAGTLKFLLNWSKIQLTAMAETGWELQNNLFSPGAQSSASCPWKPTLMGIFLKLNLKARGRLPSFLVFPYWTALGSCKSSCFKLSFLPVWTLWTGFLQHQRQGGRSPASATDKGMVTTSTRGKQLCQIDQLQCEAASLDYTYTVLWYNIWPCSPHRSCPLSSFHSQWATPLMAKVACSWTEMASSVWLNQSFLSIHCFRSSEPESLTNVYFKTDLFSNFKYSHPFPSFLSLCSNHGRDRCLSMMSSDSSHSQLSHLSPWPHHLYLQPMNCSRPMEGRV